MAAMLLLAVTGFACSSADAGGDSLSRSGNPSGDPSAESNGTPGAATTDRATLRWDAVTTRADGMPLGDLENYVVHYGTAPGAYVSTAMASTTTYTVTGLEPGTYYFAVTAMDSSGSESEVSNEVSKTIE